MTASFVWLKLNFKLPYLQLKNQNKVDIRLKLIVEPFNKVFLMLLVPMPFKLIEEIGRMEWRDKELNFHNRIKRLNSFSFI